MTSCALGSGSRLIAMFPAVRMSDKTILPAGELVRSHARGSLERTFFRDITMFDAEHTSLEVSALWTAGGIAVPSL